MSWPDAGSAIERSASRSASTVGSFVICLQTFCRRSISGPP
jgi:hypothetical protein